VLRVRRDILRAAIGGLFTARSVSTVAPGSTSSPASTAISRSSRTSTSTAMRRSRERRPRKAGPQLSRAVQLCRRPLRRPARSSRGPAELQSRSRFPAADQLQAQLRGGTLQPAAGPQHDGAQAYYEGSFNYTTDNDNHLESRRSAPSASS
jgi:hypothetical protein